MRFKYSTINSSQNELDSLPRLPITLTYENRSIELLGLVDSGATVNVLPYEIGIDLGAFWDDSQRIISLSGNLGNQPAIPFIATAKIADFTSVRLVFAWTKTTNAPLILGQTNFFYEFDVCFYQSKFEFEVKPKTN